jgi:hypothetical protein
MKVQIRKASIEDSGFFFELRNERETIKNSFKKNKIKFLNHSHWYKNKLREKNTVFLVGLTNKSQKIGIVRYEYKKRLTYVSINISKEYRGLNYGSKILKKSEKFLKKKTIIISKIKKTNKASFKIFIKNHYDVIEKINNYLLLIKIV